MINYIEKGPGLHLAIAAVGHSLVQHGSDWIASDDAAVQAVIDAYSLTDACALVIADVKALAREKILAFLPDWKQSNFNARMNEINEIRFGRELTADETADVTAMRSAWDSAKAIRQASNDHEAALLNLKAFQDVADYDIKANWPG